MEEIINENFQEEYLKVVNPLEGKEAVSYLLELPFHYIFFVFSDGFIIAVLPAEIAPINGAITN